MPPQGTSVSGGRAVPAHLTDDSIKEHFVDREPQIARVRELWGKPQGADVAVVVFHGDGGYGKSWLLEYLRKKVLTAAPTVLLDFEGPAMRRAEAILWQVRMRLSDQGVGMGRDHRFPRFDTAWALYTRAAVAAQAFTPPASHMGRAIGYLVDALANVPLVQIPATIGKVLHAVSGEVAKWWEEQGNDLLRCEPDALMDYLPRALAEDVQQVVLRANRDTFVRPVVQYDAYERLADEPDLHRDAEEAVRSLCRYCPVVLHLVVGRRSLKERWGDADEYWGRGAHLEEHPLGGLDRDFCD